MKKLVRIFILTLFLASCSNRHQEGQHEHTILCGEYCDYEVSKKK
jgi:PBP1b-binding outer membrane lipoprotein LpoB